jgi:hypothetical protein
MFNKMLLSLKARYDYDVRYQQAILNADLAAFLKFMGFQAMSTHSANVPVGPLFAARIRTIIFEDCGPCTQLVVNMALEAKLPAEVVRAIIEKDLTKLPEDIALVLQFTEHVLAHHPSADDLRDKVVALWGAQGLVAIALAISSYRVYPALKYTLGYGSACCQIQINDTFLSRQ